MAHLNGPTDAPDPERAARAMASVRDLYRRDYPLTAAAVDSIVERSPLHEAVVDLGEMIARARERHPARRARSRAAR